MKDYTYYLFDADGTLFDTTELICQCFDYSLDKYGNIKKAKEEIIKSIGMTLRSQFELHLGVLSDEQYDEMQKEHMRFQLTIYKDYLKAFPGVKEALETLKEQNKRLAIVTSRKITSLTIFLKETGIFEYFELIITPDETEKHKPEPEPALKAMSLLEAEKEESVFIGDSLFDIQCGTSAGIDTAFVTYSKTKSDQLEVKPTYLIDSLEELCV
jgi:pyrophosphatase PpaX